ncbi:MAG: hypothetical protein KIT59_12775 [Nitrosomonas sp.]|nr:hypothetical protein [Nitrosomonas sp.]
MNSIFTAKVLVETITFAGREWFYNFRELSNQFDEDAARKVASSLLMRYSKLTLNWSSERNSEWICRIYLSAKMIMMATLQLNTLAHAEGKNLRLVMPYLTYYSLLSLLRGIVYTLPEVQWDNGKLVEISHNKAINLAFDHIAQFNKKVSSELKEATLRAKAFRELISYRSPSSGDNSIQDFYQLEPIATLLAEIAQFNSELLEVSILKNTSKDTFRFLQEYIDDLASATIEGVHFFDTEDSYRLDYLRRKYPLPPNILHVMTEGHVEDFFGAWCAKDPIDDAFDPDKDWQLIFDIP